MQLRIKDKNISRDATVSATMAFFAVLIYEVLFWRLPVLTEARGFLVSKGFGATLTRSIWIPVGYPMSLVVYAWQSRLVAFSADAANLVQFALIGLCVTAGFAHLRQLAITRSSSALAMVAWLLSLPALYAGFWQATQHDKLAFLFVTLALIVSLQALRTHSKVFASIAALGTTMFVVLAVASKPIAFVLSGILIVQAVLFSSRTSYLRAAGLVAIPVVYATVFAFGYLAMMSDAWRAHSTGGDITTNLLVYLRYMTNGDYDSTFWPAQLLLVPVVMAWIFAIYRTGARKCPGHRDSVLVYFFALFSGSMVILARARFPSAYYVLIPMYAVTASLACMADSVRHSGSPMKRRAGTLLVAGIFAGLLGATFMNLTGRARLGRLMRSAHNMAEGYDLLRSRIDPQSVKSMTFVVAPPPDSYFYLISNNSHTGIDPAIPSFIFHRELTIPINELPESNAPEAEAGQVVAIWSDDFRLTEAKLSGILAYRDAPSTNTR